MERVTKSGKQAFVKILFGSILIIGLLFHIDGSYAQPQGTSNIDNNVKLLSSSHYTDSIDYLHVIGEVQNTFPESQEFVKVVATFYDSTNKTVGTSFTFTDVDVLRPEEKSPFDLVLDNKAQSGKVHNYKIQISSNAAEPMPANLKLTVGDNYYDDIGYAHILGEVTNQGTEATKFAKVSSSVYNDKKRVVATDFTFTDPPDLLPGQSAPFDIVISEHASTATFGKMFSGSVNVQSSDYAMILPTATFIIDGSSNNDNKVTSINQFDSTKSNEDEDNDDNGDGNGNGESCDPSYPDVCIPRKPPDLNCPQITERNFRVVGSDPHGFDGDNDGIGCDEVVPIIPILPPINDTETNDRPIALPSMEPEVCTPDGPPCPSCPEGVEAGWCMDDDEIDDTDDGFPDYVPPTDEDDGYFPSCGGVPCTEDEKKDTTTDPIEEEEPEESGEESQSQLGD